MTNSSSKQQQQEPQQHSCIYIHIRTLSQELPGAIVIIMQRLNVVLGETKKQVRALYVYILASETAYIAHGAKKTECGRKVADVKKSNQAPPAFEAWTYITRGIPAEAIRYAGLFF